jgi:hypothetical protein
LIGTELVASYYIIKHYISKNLDVIKEMGGIGLPIPPKPLLRQINATLVGII